jgi:hypothetical protein
VRRGNDDGDDDEDDNKDAGFDDVEYQDGRRPFQGAAPRETTRCGVEFLLKSHAKLRGAQRVFVKNKKAMDMKI